jgi:hypothetical protein
MIDFASMAVGDKANFPSKSWDSENVAIYDAANTYCAAQPAPRPQFQAEYVRESGLWQLERTK